MHERVKQLKLKFSGIAIITAAVIFISGCSFSNGPQSKIKSDLKQTTKIERQAFIKNAQLNAMMQQEKDLFEEIIKQRDNNASKVKKLSTKAIDSAKKRKKTLLSEKAQIEKSQKLMKDAKEQAKQMKNGNDQAAANEMLDAYDKRIKAFGEWNDAFLTSIKGDEKLYQLLQDKSVNADQLEGQLEIVNHLYKTVSDKEKNFNQATEQFNQKKTKFYKQTD